MGKRTSAWLTALVMLQANALVMLQANALEGTFTQPDPHTVVYRVESNASARLQARDISLKARQTADWRQAQQQLQHYLELAKTHNSARYAGFGIQLYRQLAEALRQYPDVQLAYADLLQYTHQFEQAIAMLTQLQIRKTVAVQANLRLFTLHLMQGRVGEARQACRALGQARSVLMSTICGLWLDGLQTASQQSITRLEGLIAVLPADNSLENWALEALIDLRVQRGDTARAMEAFTAYEHQNPDDAAMGKLILDALLFNGEFERAAGFLETLPETEPFVIRRAIVETRLGNSGENLQRAQQLIEFYQLSEDPNHYYDIALWYWLQAGQPAAAWQFAALNWERFKYIQDFQLLRHLGPQVGRTIPASAWRASDRVGPL